MPIKFSSVWFTFAAQKSSQDFDSLSRRDTKEVSRKIMISIWKERPSKRKKKENGGGGGIL